MRIFHAVKIGFALAGTTAPATAIAHSDKINCGTTYVVEKADSLSNISGWAYGTTAHQDLIHQANIAAIGSDPSKIVVGMTLNIPCLAGETSVAGSQPADGTPAMETDVASATPTADLKLLTVEGFDVEQVAALLDDSALSVDFKRSLTNAVYTSKDSPELLEPVLDNIKVQLGL